MIVPVAEVRDVIVVVARVEVPETSKIPATLRRDPGVVVPIPTLPEAFIVKPFPAPLLPESKISALVLGRTTSEPLAPGVFVIDIFHSLF